MTWTELEDLLRQAAPAVDSAALLRGIAERTHRYTDERDRLAAPMPARERDRDLAARALFFTLADAPKVGIPVAELAARGKLPVAEPLRILDVGAGCGAMTFGLHAALPEQALSVVAVDTDPAALDVLSRVARSLPLTVRTQVGDITRSLPEGPFDLVLAGTVMNEIPPGARLSLVSALVGRLAPDGAAILVEPALRETARALHELRDAVLEKAIAHIYAPCTRTGPCPSLLHPRDWCHEDRPAAAPPRLRSLIARTGLRQHGMKFSYIVLRREPGTLADGAVRIVSGALDQKGTIERIGCGDAGWVRLRVLKRDKDRALADTRRGDLLYPDGGQERITSS